MNNPKLAPCPHCGFDATIAAGGPGDYCGACSDLRCRAEGPTRATKQEAADAWNQRASKVSARLQFLLSQFQMNSPSMDGQHSYRFRSGGWPMQEFRGPNIEAAIDSAMAEVEKHKEDVK